MEHTPGEWKADNGDSELWGVFTDLDDDGICYMCEPSGVLLRPGEAQANAERIVKAVNCHNDLVEALKALNKYLEAGYPQNMRLKEIAVVLLDKALAKAEGK